MNSAIFWTPANTATKIIFSIVLIPSMLIASIDNAWDVKIRSALDELETPGYASSPVPKSSKAKGILDIIKQPREIQKLISDYVEEEFLASTKKFNVSKLEFRHLKHVNKVQIGSDGKSFMIIYDDNTIAFVSPVTSETGEISFDRHDIKFDSPLIAAFLPDSKTLIVLEHQSLQFVKLIKPKKGELYDFTRIGLPEQPTSLAISSDGNYIFVATLNHLALLNIQKSLEDIAMHRPVNFSWRAPSKGQIKKIVTNPAQKNQFAIIYSNSPSSDYVAFYTYSDDGIKKEKSTLINENITSGAYSPDGNLFAVGATKNLYIIDLQEKIKFYYPVSYPITQIGFTKDNVLIWNGQDNRSIRYIPNIKETLQQPSLTSLYAQKIWTFTKNIAYGDEQWELFQPAELPWQPIIILTTSQNIKEIAISPKSSTFAILHDNSDVEIYDPKPLHEYTEHDS